MICFLSLLIMQHIRHPVERLLSDPDALSLLIYLETGRKTQTIPTAEATEPVQTTVATEPVQKGVSFTHSDADLVQVSNFSGYALDIPALLSTQLQWNLTESQPKVLILHSHATESYTQTAHFSYTPSAAYRTLDTERNMVRVGETLKEALEKKGIGVIHDTTLHDHPSYNDAYIHSREAMQQWLSQYPSICLVIDLHRDAAGDTAAKQLTTATVINGTHTAQVMLVVGSNAGGRQHANWKENFALAVKLMVMVLGLMGHASMWLAVFADSGVAMLCVLNSIRMLYKK